MSFKKKEYFLSLAELKAFSIATDNKALKWLAGQVSETSGPGVCLTPGTSIRPRDLQASTAIPRRCDRKSEIPISINVNQIFLMMWKQGKNSIWWQLESKCKEVEECIFVLCI